ncbi:WecB/TagA/CpsF family glycosyltransferase [Coraliomargarita parva]|uniref:WecB/TagA/CpsF family glycosyltransferase n=1 Tax=Coraliomargarita parva TaxID=3014050 RepID=UPI0022B40382|nr:WecB/TagA/CpsF family glycosyltransferase [Coraliomargarita parva]
MKAAETNQIEERRVLGQRLHATSYEHATQLVIEWGKARSSRYVCVTNVHVVMEGWDSEEYRSVVNSADLITPDGVPLVWSLRALGVGHATRVYGPDLTLHICRAAAREGVKVALYGGTEESLKDFVAVLDKTIPGIEVACAISPPFRPLTDEEDREYTEQIESSGAGVLFVGIGCPKQERWMAAHKGRISMPMLGVGAAFDFHSGRVKQSPPLMQKLGLEWLFRLFMEPRRLWRRYAWHNPRFIAFFGWQYLAYKFGSNST